MRRCLTTASGTASFPRSARSAGSAETRTTLGLGDGGLWTSIADLTSWLRVCNMAEFAPPLSVWAPRRRLSSSTDRTWTTRGACESRPHCTRTADHSWRELAALARQDCPDSRTPVRYPARGSPRIPVDVPVLTHLAPVGGSSCDTSPRLQRVRVTCWDDSMRLAALVAAVAAALDLLVLELLHLVSPEVDPVSRPVSEYALGDFAVVGPIRTLAEGLRRSRSRWPCAASEPPRCCWW